MHDLEALKAEVLPRSEADSFEDARHEWSLSKVEISMVYDKCACGHKIKHICYLKNLLNGNKVKVGNTCVNKFIGIDTAGVFRSLQRLISGKGKEPSPDLRKFCKNSAIIDRDEYEFLTRTYRKTALSQGCLLRRVEVCGKIVRHMTKNRR